MRVRPVLLALLATAAVVAGCVPHGNGVANPDSGAFSTTSADRLALADPPSRTSAPPPDSSPHTRAGTPGKGNSRRPALGHPNPHGTPKAHPTKKPKSHLKPESQPKPKPRPKPKPKQIHPPAPPATSSAPSNCTPGYDPCVPYASDVDCAGGSGNGPAYVDGPIKVTGSDPYGLDADGDGWGCES